MRRFEWALTLALFTGGCWNNQAQTPPLTNQVFEESPPAEEMYSRNRIRKTLLSYISQPRFSSQDFLEQITGTKAELEMYDLDEGEVYFSIRSRDYSDQTLPKLTECPEKVEFGKPEEGRLILGNYVLKKPGFHFFKFPANDFKADTKAEIRIPFGRIVYTIGMRELIDFSDYKNAYGGYISAITQRLSPTVVRTVANHGAFVSKKEPSLTRLAEQIFGGSTSKEATAQMLLDFVTTQIRYSGLDATDDAEVLKQPHEVLMTREADCSGKVILYSSLLEQADIGHRLVYANMSRGGHIAVAVEGNFASTNGMSFRIGEKTYTVAETTAPGFKIGRSKLAEQITLDKIRCLQKPAPDAPITDAKTGQPLEFLGE